MKGLLSEFVRLLPSSALTVSLCFQSTALLCFSTQWSCFFCACCPGLAFIPPPRPPTTPAPTLFITRNVWQFQCSQICWTLIECALLVISAVRPNAYSWESTRHGSIWAAASTIDVFCFSERGEERRISRLPTELLASQTARQGSCWPSWLLALCSFQAFSFCPNNVWSRSQRWGGANEML